MTGYEVVKMGPPTVEKGVSKGFEELLVGTGGLELGVEDKEMGDGFGVKKDGQEDDEEEEEIFQLDAVEL